MPNERIMTPYHPRWSEFIARLSGIRRCQGTNAHARSILMSMGGFDVEESLRMLADMGGRCDCEIELDLAGAGERSAG